MKRFIPFLLGLLVLALGACKTQVHKKARPDWVAQRPVNTLYYIGIGIASKSSNPYNYQQVAKKNALNDLVSEIKVTVASNSVLSQYQLNKSFSQQFESEVQITAMSTVEEFTVVDSWEDQEYFWIYYRLSKDEYKQAAQRKLNAAIDQAEFYLQQSDELTVEQWVQSIRLKIKALIALQLYLHQNIEGTYRGKQVYLVSETIRSLQTQLFSIQLSSNVRLLKAKTGKGIAEPFDVIARFMIDSNIAVPYVPVELKLEQGKLEGTLRSDADRNGIATFAITAVQSSVPVQTLRAQVDMDALMRGDSVSNTLREIIRTLEKPSTHIRLQVEPIRIFLKTDEKNLGIPMQASYLDAALKRRLTDDGCVFTESRNDADYILTIQSDSKSKGIIWGNMRSSALDVSISLTDAKLNTEVFKDGLREVKGFQTTDENAGLDAYKTATQMVMEQLYPAMRSQLLKGN